MAAISNQPNYIMPQRGLHQDLDLPSEIRNNIYTILLVENRNATFVGAVIAMYLDQKYTRGYRSNKTLEV